MRCISSPTPLLHQRHQFRLLKVIVVSTPPSPHRITTPEITPRSPIPYRYAWAQAAHRLAHRASKLAPFFVREGAFCRCVQAVCRGWSRIYSRKRWWQPEEVIFLRWAHVAKRAKPPTPGAPSPTSSENVLIYGYTYTRTRYVHTRRVSPRRADALHGSARARNYRGCTRMMYCR